MPTGASGSLYHAWKNVRKVSFRCRQKRLQELLKNEQALGSAILGWSMARLTQEPRLADILMQLHKQQQSFLSKPQQMQVHQQRSRKLRMEILMHGRTLTYDHCKITVLQKEFGIYPSKLQDSVLGKWAAWVFFEANAPLE